MLGGQRHVYCSRSTTPLYSASQQDSEQVADVVAQRPEQDKCEQLRL